MNEEGSAFSATYDFGGVKLFGNYGRYKRTGTVTQDSWLAGLEWKLGRHVLLAAYQDSQDGGASSAATQPACSLVGLGYRYDFTKRTSFIAELAVVDNKSGNLCNFGTSPLTISAGQDPRGFAAGLRHLF